MVSNVEKINKAEVYDLALLDANNKLAPPLKRYLREKDPLEWNKALNKIVANIDDQEAEIKNRAEIDRRPSDLQLFQFKHNLLRIEIQKRMAESKSIIEQERQETVTTSMSELVKEFRQIRLLLEKVLKK
jgi:hypothetical protein